MNTNNENRRWSANRSGASRDGKFNEKRNPFGNSRRNDSNSENNRKYDNNKSGYRSNENRNSDRPRNNNFNPDRKPYGNNDHRNSLDRPFKKDDRYSSSDRPRYERRDDRGSSSDKPRFERRDNRDERYGNQSNQQRRYDSNERGGERKLSFRKAGDVKKDGGFVETRFDNRKDGVTFRKRTNSDDYDPNNKYSKKKQFEYKKNLVDPTKPIRLNKFLANAGICSRREADEYIQAGVISVNGEIISELGTKVLITDKVMFHNEPVRIEQKIYLLLNKPKDCVTTSEDTHARLTVLDLVKNACSERIYPVGRLDRNTTGVLLLTNDGDLASKLTHPKYDKKKIYHVGLDRELEEKDYHTILEGVDLGDFTIKADALEFVKDDNQREVGIEIHSGQNRVVRRIFEKLGYKITKLDRVFFAGLTKKNVPRGKYRFLNEREVIMLQMGAHE